MSATQCCRVLFGAELHQGSPEVLRQPGRKHGIEVMDQAAMRLCERREFKMMVTIHQAACNPSVYPEEAFGDIHSVGYNLKRLLIGIRQGRELDP